MSYRVETIKSFEKKVKKLSKKYPSIKKDLSSIIKQLETKPDLGIPLGNNCYKIRCSIESKNAGKSGGGRVITYLKSSNNIIFLISIYDKSEKESITDEEINKSLAHIKANYLKV